MSHVSLAFVVVLLILTGAAGAIGPATLTKASSMNTSGPENILDWPMFHHDPARVGYSGSTAPSRCNLIWSFGTGANVFSSPAIVNDRVYVGATNGKVYCLNAENGASMWSYSTGDDVLSSPAIAYDKVYVGSRDNKVYCLNAENGAYIWSFIADDDVDSSPAVVNGRVYIGSLIGKVYCLNAENGALVWNYTTGGRVDSSPAIDNNKVYFGSYDNKVYCLNAENGALIWSFTTGHLVFSSPAVVNGKVYVGSYDNKFYCLNAENGALIWSYTTHDDVYSSPAVAYGKVYFGSKDYKVYCLDAGNGALIWSFPTGARVFSSPAVADNKVYVSSNDYKIYCLNAENGVSIWDFSTVSPYMFSSPAVAYGKVFVGSGQAVYCFGGIYGASVSISPHYKGGAPGGMLDYTVNVKNTGSDEDTYTLTLTDNDNWVPTILPTSLTVPAGENGVAMLSVVIPENAVYCTKDNIIVTATSQGNNSVKASDSCIAHSVLVKTILYPTADVYAFGEYSRVQLKFDISNIPSGSEILSAKLCMFRFAADGWNGNIAIDMVNNQLWGETITASEFDAQTLTNVENYASKFTSHGWDNLNVLNQLKVDHDIGHTYASFRLRWTNDNGGNPSSGVNDGRFLAIESQPDNLLIVFNSREYDNQDPYLEVTYISP